MDIMPVFSRLIVKPKGVPDKIGEIFIPKTSKEAEATEGEVVAIGNECTKVFVGAIVYYGQYSGFDFSRNGERYRIMNEEDVLGIVIGGNHA